MWSRGGDCAGAVSSTFALVCIHRIYASKLVRLSFTRSRRYSTWFLSYGVDPVIIYWIAAVFEPMSLFPFRTQVPTIINLAPAVVLWSIPPGHAEPFSCFGQSFALLIALSMDNTLPKLLFRTFITRARCISFGILATRITRPVTHDPSTATFLEG